MKNVDLINACFFLGLNPFKKLLPNEKDYLEEDLNTITRINELVKNLSYPHHVNRS